MKKKPDFSSVRDFLNFNRAEQRGIIIILFLFLSMILTAQLIPGLYKGKDYSFEAFDEETEVFCRSQANDPVLYSKSCSDTLRDSRQHVPFIIPLNSADTFDLQRLPGIGPAFARRIIAYRNRLGGFVAKDQLLQVFGMDRERYMKIEKHLVLGPDSVQRIPVNTATFKELMRHPYFSFELAKQLMLERKMRKKFMNLEELRTIPGMTDSLYFQIHPYVKIDP